ncbi:MAG: hypothetical protein K6E50_06630 [Lachnospiraceae bacterium]|nr:hypothetical protein [Lachnospiraceae bacterium]
MAENKLQEYKCPNCTGPLEFQGDIQKMVCEYCGSEFDMSEFKQSAEQKQEKNSEWEQKQSAELAAGANGMQEWECKACGAVLVSDGQVGATECPYCGNPAIVESTFSGMNLPDGIIPFAIKKDTAMQKMKDFYSGKKLIPDEFVKNNRMEKIQGVYVPFWLFDCGARGTGFYKATKVKRRFTKTVKDSNGQDIQEHWKEVEEYAVSRSAHMRYAKVPADGAKEMKDEYMDSIEPFDYSKIIDYEPAYFSGYLANKYDESAEEVKGRVDTRIKSTTESAIRETVTGYDSVNQESCNITIEDGKIDYCMLPVWMLTTRWNGGQYTFAVNGQTGKVTGDMPVDNNKATAMFFKTLLICAVICAVIGYFVLSDIVTAVIVAAVIGLIVGAITVSSAKSSMVSHQKTEASEYLLKDTFKLTGQNDRYVRSYEEKG